MKPYKALRKKLSKKYVCPYTPQQGYQTMGAIESWVEQSGIRCTAEHVDILCSIMGGVFYPYQKSDRRTVIKYLKRNKKWKKQKHIS